MALCTLSRWLTRVLSDRQRSEPLTACSAYTEWLNTPPGESYWIRDATGTETVRERRMHDPLDVWVSLMETSRGSLYVLTSLQGPWEHEAPARIALHKIRMRAGEGLEDAGRPEG